MSDETPEIEAEKRKRPRRRRKSKDSASEATPASEALNTASASEPDATAQPSTSDSGDAAGESSAIDARAEDEQAEAAAADVMLEADDEAEGEVAEAEEPKPPRRRRRPSGGAESAAARKPPARRAPAPRRRRERPAGPPPVVRAQARYVRTSARKARLVCDNIRGKTVQEARAILAHTPRAVARDWSKLLESAVANAEHNHELIGEDLYVKAVRADEGPTVKRIQPRAMGRAYRIRKRTTHLTILLTPKE